MASLSERLKRERELRGISLKQISEETRIGVRFLEALEENKLEVIPGEFYRRSYLRAYTRYLGLDEDRALNAYDYSVKVKRAQDEPGEPGEPGEEGPPKERSSLPMWVKWAAVSIFIVVPTVLLLRAMPGSRERGTIPPSLAATSSAPLPTKTNSAADPQQVPNPFPTAAAVSATGSELSQEGADVVPDDGSLHLALSVEESCWLEIEADGVVVVSGLKEAGFRDEVSARHEVRLWLGNAGGVKLSVNDRPVRPLGRPGQVRKDLTITTENYRNYILSAGGER